MRFFNITILILSGFLGLVSFSKTGFSAPVGTVQAVVIGLHGAPPGDKLKMKFPHDGIVGDERLKTGNGAAAVIQFLDESLLTLGEDTDLVVDKYIYDPAGSGGESIFKLTRGVMRFISGKMKPDRVIIDTPASLIGIRGSEAVITVFEDGTTVINCFVGIFTIFSKSAGTQVQITPNQRVLIPISGPFGEVENSQALPIQDEFITFGIDGIGGTQGDSGADVQSEGGGGTGSESGGSPAGQGY